MARNTDLHTRYEQELRLFPSTYVRVAMAGLLAVFLLAPMLVDDFWLSILVYCGVFAIGAIGLNLLTGFTGQVSLGHAFFVAAGAYTVANIGAKSGMPMIVWLPAAAVMGAVIGSVVGPFALRLRGNYLAIVTLGLLFFGDHLFNNWRSVTGGGNGVNIDADLALGPLDFTHLKLLGQTYTRQQGLFWLVWGTVALCALLAKNVVRTRPGRAMQAVRDRDLAAEVIGVSLFRYKLGAFALSSAFAAIAGAFYGAAVQQFVSPVEFGGGGGLILSITYIAVIIVGGMGTIFGSILGALFVAATPRVIEKFSSSIPFLSSGPGSGGIISVASFNNLIFGVFIIAFLMLEPRGLAAVWFRIKAYFKAWPFSY
jgi:branched-chain amino acid transport system permease protein